jgi:hypothetical protein
LAEGADGIVESFGSSARVWPPIPIEYGIDHVGDLRGGSVCDSPQSGDDVPVAEELHRRSEVDCFIEVVHAPSGGLACGEECQVPVLGALPGQISDRQSCIPQGETAACRVGVLLAGVAGQMHPGVGGDGSQDGGARCL